MTILLFFAAIAALLAPFLWPRRGTAGRANADLHLLMVFPPIIILSWMLFFPGRDGCRQVAWWLTAVPGLAWAASGLLPLVLLPIMRGARAFTVAVGVVGFAVSTACMLLAFMWVTDCWI